MAKFADQLKKNKAMEKPSKDTLNNRLEMEIIYSYNHQNMIIRIRRQIDTKAYAFEESIVSFSELCSVYSPSEWLNLITKDNADHDRFSQQQLQVQPKKENQYLII